MTRAPADLELEFDVDLQAVTTAIREEAFRAASEFIRSNLKICAFDPLCERGVLLIDAAIPDVDDYTVKFDRSLEDILREYLAEYADDEADPRELAKDIAFMLRSIADRIEAG